MGLDQMGRAPSFLTDTNEFSLSSEVRNGRGWIDGKFNSERVALLTLLLPRASKKILLLGTRLLAASSILFRNEIAHPKHEGEWVRTSPRSPDKG